MIDTILKNKNVFIFDLDGTLIDSVGIWNRVDYLLIKQLANIEVDENTINHERDETVGNSTSQNPYLDYVAYLIDKYHINMSIEDVIAYRRKLTDWYLTNEVVTKPYAKELITLLKDMGKTLVLATTTNDRCVDIYMNKNLNTSVLRLDEFNLRLTMSDVDNFKPSPEIHLKSMDILKYTQDEAIVFEDTYGGCLSAVAAGIEVIAVKEEHSINREDEIRNVATYYVDSLEEIYDFYQKMPKKAYKCEKSE